MFIEPYCLTAPLTDEVFLRHNPPQLLENIPLNVRQNMLFVHNGTPPHYRGVVHDYLNIAFPIRWT